MQLFYVVNGWAGRVAWVDEAARLFYVGALPLLWSALAWLLLAAPRSWSAFSRRRIAASALVALAGATLCWQGIEWASRAIWNTPIFSPRPFVTHWVNLLVVEPNDNSYPCIEVLLASIAATLCWAASIRAGALAWCWVFLYGVARIFCGSNYPIDVGAGWLLGWALSTFSLALWRAPLRIPTRGGGRLKWRQRNQAVLSLSCVALVMGAALIEMLGAPQALHRSTLLEASHAAPALAGVPGAAPAGALPVDAAYGRQPRVEAAMRQALESLRLAHKIVDVEVAQVTVGQSPFRVASASFEVQPGRADERREVARSAARIARACFAADPTTQNVDVLGVIFQARHNSESFGEGGGSAAPEPIKPLPVFTASIPRSKLILSGRVAWANWSRVDPGLWLRARSRLFIDSQVLPPAPIATPTPVPTPIPTARPKPMPLARPLVPRPVFRPKPMPKVMPKPKMMPQPRWMPRAFQKQPKWGAAWTRQRANAVRKYLRRNGRARYYGGR